VPYNKGQTYDNGTKLKTLMCCYRVCSQVSNVTCCMHLQGRQNRFSTRAWLSAIYGLFYNPLWQRSLEFCVLERIKHLAGMKETGGACRGMGVISGPNTLQISLCTDYIKLPLQTPDTLPSVARN
jgi:hypothetical protein